MVPFEAVLSPDDFLQRLDLHEVDVLIDRADAHRLFEAAVELLSARGEAWPANDPEPEDFLAARVPGTSWHVRLGGPSKDELDTFNKLVAIIGFSTGGDLRAMSTAALVSVYERVKRTHVEHGERSIVDAVAAGMATATEVTVWLTSRPCRHAGMGCAFEASSACTIATAQAQQIAETLALAGILRQRNAYEPFEYAIAI